MTNNKLTDETLSAWKTEAKISLGETARDSVEYSHHEAILALVTEIQEHRKAAAEPVLYVMGMGCAFDAETASTCKGAVDSWVGEWNQERLPGQEECRTVPLYTAPAVQETGVYKDMLNIIGLLENNEWAEHCTSTVLGSLLESEITRLVGKEQPAPVVPVGLRMALSNAGIAAPESDEMLAATHEKYIQALVTWVKDRKPFQPAPVVPEEMPKGLAGQIVSLLAHNIGDKFLAQKIWNACRNAILNGDTFRENSISSTNNFREIAETSTNSPVIPDGYALVPVEPTDEMIAAAMECDNVVFDSKDPTAFCVQHREIYYAMVDAAPALNKGEY